MKKSNNILHCSEFILHPYQTHCRVVVAKNATAAARELAPEVKVDKNSRAIARLLTTNRGFLLVFTKGAFLTHGTIAHEIGHLLLKMVDWLGEGIDLDKHENWTWFLDTTTDAVYAALDSAGVKVKVVRR